MQFRKISEIFGNLDAIGFRILLGKKTKFKAHVFIGNSCKEPIKANVFD